VSIDFIENLHERLQKEANGAEDMVEKLERNAKDPNLGKQQGLMEGTVINQYEATADQLLKAVPDDPDALAAMDHIAALRQRVSDALCA